MPKQCNTVPWTGNIGALLMNELSEEERYWVWLAGIDGVFVKWFYILQSVYPRIRSLFECPERIRRDIPNFPPQIAASVQNAANREYIDAMFEQIREKGLCVTTALSTDYPYTLQALSDPPPVLYYKGMLPSLWERSVSVVGTRRPTRNGERFVRKITEEIAMQDVVVVSGMARGIDSAAHAGALAADGQTVAVLGCGADIVYPKENKKLYERIAEKGAVLSEFRPGTPPVAENFPRRNRIIAALSGATVVSEGGIKSGAGITADIALTLGKQVFAIPCEPGSDVSALPISLLKSGAFILSESADLMDVMGWEKSMFKNKKENKTGLGLDFFQEQIYNSLLKGNLNADQLANRLGVPVGKVNSALTVMELMGAVERLPGNNYCIQEPI